MLDYADARSLVIEHTRPLNRILRPLPEARGFAAAEDLRASHPLPLFDNSAMDGYAVRHQDIKGASRNTAATLKVVGSIAAGQIAKVGLPGGAAIRIMTGAPLPPGADTVVPFEDTDELARKKNNEAADEVSVFTEFSK